MFKSPLFVASIALLAGCVSETHRVPSDGTVSAAPGPATRPGAAGVAIGQTSGTMNMTRYGDPAAAVPGQAVPVATLLADPAAYAGKPVRVTGTVSDVCAKKGCWVRLDGRDKTENLFVKFTCPIDGRLIPIEAKGKPAVVEGKLVITEISEDQARHYAKDGGATDAQAAAIVGPQKEITLESPAALIAD